MSRDFFFFLETEQPQRPPQHLASLAFFQRQRNSSTVINTIAGAA